MISSRYNIIIGVKKMKGKEKESNMNNSFRWFDSKN